MIKRVISLKFFLWAIVFSFVPNIARADLLPASVQVFTTHGHFDIMVNAFQKLALITNDTAYNGLFFGMAGIIAFGTAVGLVGRGVLRNKFESSDWLYWGGTLVFAVMLWSTFIVPKTNLTIYDKYQNKNITIPGVPLGITLIAGLFSTMEEGILEIIDTTSIDHMFSEEHGALTFKIMENVFSGDVDLSGEGDGSYYTKNINNYIRDCFLYELQRPGTSLKLDDVYINTDFETLFSLAQNPAKFTTIYSNSSQAGDMMSCTAAWGSISAFLAGVTDVSAENNKFWKARCAKADMDDNTSGAGGIPAVKVCEAKMEDFIGSQIVGSSVASSNLFKQYLIASEIYKASTELDPDQSVLAQGSMAKGRSLIAGGIMANEWTPHLKAMMFAAFIGMTPFLLIFMATPLYQRVIVFMLGMFVFFTIWAVCRDILGQMAMTQAISLMTEIKNGQLGLKSMLMFEGHAVKAYAIFGNYEAIAFTLAGTFSAIFIKTGGAGLTRYGQTELGNMNRFGQDAGNKSGVGNPTERTRSQQGATQAVAVEALHNSHSMGSFVANEATKQVRDYSTMERLRNDYGGPDGDANRAAEKAAHANQIKNQTSVESADATEYAAAYRGWDAKHAAAQVQRLQANSKMGEATALDKAVKSIQRQNPGTRYEQVVDFMKDVQTQGQLGNVSGLFNAYQNAVKHNGFQGELMDYVEMQKYQESSKGFMNADTAQKIADQYYGGRTDLFFKDQAEYQQRQTAGTMDAIRKSGASIGDTGELMAHAQAMSNLAKAHAAAGLGDQGYYDQAASQTWESVAKNTSKLAMDDILSHGKLSAGTQKMWDQVASDPYGKAQLRSMGMQNVTANGIDETKNLAAFLNSNGHNVSAGDFDGANIGLNMHAGENGQPSVGYVAAKNGTVVSSEDFKQSRMYMTADQAQAATGRENAPEGFYDIYSAANGQGLMYANANAGFAAKVNDQIMSTSTEGGQQTTRIIDADTGETVYKTGKAGHNITRENVDTDRTELGPKITPETIRNMVLNDEPGNTFGDYVFNPNRAPSRQQSYEQAAIVAAAKDFSNYINETGILSGATKVNGNGKAWLGQNTGLLDSAAGVSAGVQGMMGIDLSLTSTETSSRNLNMIKVGSMIEKARGYGREMSSDGGKTINYDAARDYLNKAMGNMYSGLTEDVKGETVTDNRYGLSAGPALALEGAKLQMQAGKWVGEQAKKIVMGED